MGVNPVMARASSASALYCTPVPVGVSVAARKALPPSILPFFSVTISLMYAGSKPPITWVNPRLIFVPRSSVSSQIGAPCGVLPPLPMGLSEGNALRSRSKNNDSEPNGSAYPLNPAKAADAIFSASDLLRTPFSWYACSAARTGSVTNENGAT